MFKLSELLHVTRQRLENYAARGEPLPPEVLLRIAGMLRILAGNAELLERQVSGTIALPDDENVISLTDWILRTGKQHEPRANGSSDGGEHGA